MAERAPLTREVMGELVERIRGAVPGERVVVSDVTFPTTTWKGPSLRGVDFFRCDIRRLDLRAPFRRNLEVRDCSFTDVRMPSLRSATIRECRFQRSIWTEFAGFYRDVLTDCAFVRCRWNQTGVRESELRRVTISDLRAVHPHLSDSTIVESSITGTAQTFVASGCTFDLVDLSGLHLREFGPGWRVQTDGPLSRLPRLFRRPSGDPRRHRAGIADAAQAGSDGVLPALSSGAHRTVRPHRRPALRRLKGR